MSAGFAAAEVSVGGSANIGAKYAEGALQETTLHHEIDMNVVGTTTTNNGLTFSATIELDTDNNSGSLGDPSGVVSMGGAFGTLSLGAVDAASDSVGFGALEVGFDGIGLDDVVEGEYDTGVHDVHYSNTFGAFTFALSASELEADDTISAGFGYKGPVAIAVGYADDGARDVTSISLKGSAAGFGYTLAATDDSVDGSAYGLGVTYGLGNGMAVQAGFADSDASTDASFGVGMTYALGGGATLGGAIGSIDGANKADLGVNFSF